jgi:hypothetical protein
MPGAGPRSSLQDDAANPDHATQDGACHLARLSWACQVRPFRSKSPFPRPCVYPQMAAAARRRGTIERRGT